MRALSNAASQLVAKGFDHKLSFDFKAMGANALTSAISGGAGVATAFPTAKFVSKIVTAEVTALMQQVALKATRLERHFDWKSLEAAAFNAVTDYVVGSDHKSIPSTVMAAGASSFVDQVNSNLIYNGRAGWGNVSAVSVGSMVGTFSGKKLDDLLVVQDAVVRQSQEPVAQPLYDIDMSYYDLMTATGFKGSSPIKVARDHKVAKNKDWDAKGSVKESLKAKKVANTVARDNSYGVDLLNSVANSEAVTGINAAGDWIANTSAVRAINMINPIVVGAGLLEEAYSSLRNGSMINGVAGFGLAMMSAIPGEAVAINSFRSGMRTFGLFGGGGVEIVMQAATKHPLAGLSPENVVRLIDEVGLGTPRNQLILWSGLGRGREGIRLSQGYAHANGGITLEMTSGGKWLDKLDLYGSNSPFTQVQADKIWHNVSTRMIEQASGQVRSVIGQVRPASVYRAEQSEILMNNKILGLDELYLRPKFTFDK